MVEKAKQQEELARRLEDLNIYKSNELVLSLAKAIKFGHLDYEDVQRALKEVDYDISYK